MMMIKSVMLPLKFGSVISLIGGEQRGINRAGTVDSVKLIIIYGPPKNH